MSVIRPRSSHGALLASWWEVAYADAEREHHDLFTLNVVSDHPMLSVQSGAPPDASEPQTAILTAEPVDESGPGQTTMDSEAASFIRPG